MQPRRVRRIARIISLVSKLLPHHNFLFHRTGRERGIDERVSLRVRHVRVIQPDLPSRRKRIVRHADDDRALPVRQPREVSVRRGRHRRLPGRLVPEHVDPLVPLQRPEGVSI